MALYLSRLLFSSGCWLSHRLFPPAVSLEEEPYRGQSGVRFQGSNHLQKELPNVPWRKGHVGWARRPAYESEARELHRQIRHGR